MTKPPVCGLLSAACVSSVFRRRHRDAAFPLRRPADRICRGVYWQRVRFQGGRYAEAEI